MRTCPSPETVRILTLALMESGGKVINGDLVEHVMHSCADCGAISQEVHRGRLQVSRVPGG